VRPVAEAPRRVLAIVSDRIGDVIFCTPALRLLRHAWPETRIEVLAQSAAAAEVLRGSPRVDTVWLPGDVDALAGGGAFDRLLDFKHNRLARALAPRLGLAPELRPRTGHEHEADTALALVEQATGVGRAAIPLRYELFPDGADEARVDALLGDARVRPDDVLVGCHAGCNRVARRGWRPWKRASHPKAWPPAHYGALAARLARTHPKLRLVLTGSPSEAALARRIARRASRAIDVVGRTSVRELLVLASRCRVFLTADTGPLHLACAAGVPLVTLFGPTPVSWFGPWPPAPHRTVLQGDPLSGIEVGRVLAAVERALEAGAPVENGLAAGAVPAADAAR